MEPMAPARPPSRGLVEQAPMLTEEQIMAMDDEQVEEMLAKSAPRSPARKPQPSLSLPHDGRLTDVTVYVCVFQAWRCRRC